MTTFFFYGTLCHVPLLELVLGRPRDRITLRDAVLHGHAARWAKDEAFPMILPETGSSAPGLLAEGLSEEDVARLRFYEGGFEYDLDPVEVQAGDDRVSAKVFLAGEGRWQPSERWSLTDWQKRWAPISSLRPDM